MAWPPTEEQQRVIDHDPSRHARILAGPGTGKSATVIRLMLRLGAEGRHGRLLTFTRAATNELKEKVAEHPEVLDPPSTVHSFAIATLLANPGSSGLPEPIRIADDWEWNELIRVHLGFLIDCGVRLVNRARDEMASNWESLEENEDPNLPEDVRNRFAGAWEQHRRVFGYSLLSELPFRLLRALEDHEALDLGQWEFLVVDEYQDLNQCDLSVLKQITYRGRALIGAGDDDQSIYSFRRAHPIGIRRFVEDDYPGADDYSLTISQRCATSVLQWARHVIEGLPGRPTRPQLTAAPHCVPGEARYLRFNTWDQEVEGVAKLVKWLTAVKGIPPEDVAIMFRSNNNDAWSEPLAERLRAEGVPVVDTAEVAEILGERSNRRLLALARLVVNKEDSLAWWTMLHLEHGIGPAVRDHFYDGAVAADHRFVDQLLAEHARGYPDLPNAQRQRVRSVVQPTLELIERVDLEAADLGDGGWGRWLADQAESFGGCEDRFVSLLHDLDDVVDRQEGLGRFLSQVQPVGRDIRSGRSAGAVRLMSMASSKGLTVRAAIVVGVEEGVVPHPTGHPDEERRLLYVAMTRSTEYLYLTWSGRRTGPTARTGAPRVAAGRNRCPLLTHGPVASTDGRVYLNGLGA
ncbi:MAG TPA: ATP-dependent helicase [Acidimicrobiales bacterium]|nr:ATP-dependent helicase [Acidimicrobiales bacterium]